MIALTVTVIMIVALIAFVLAGLKNAQLAQNQSKATKLAQETMEQIKTIRDRDGSVTFSYPDLGGSIEGISTTSKFSDLWAINMSNGCGGSGFCYFQLNGSTLSGNYADPNAKDTLENIFTRQIIFEDSSPLVSTVEKRVTVKVKWSDSSGEHESNIQTILTKI